MNKRIALMAVATAILPFFVLGVLSGTPIPPINGISVAEASSPDTCSYFDSPVLRRIYKCDGGNANNTHPLIAPPQDPIEIHHPPIICDFASRPALRRMYGCGAQDKLAPEYSVVNKPTLADALDLLFRYIRIYIGNQSLFTVHSSFPR